MPTSGEYRDLQKKVSDWVESITQSAPKITAEANAIADLKSLLDSFNAEDFSSEATLISVLTKLNTIYEMSITIENKLETIRLLISSLDTKDYTTETTLTTFKMLFENATAQVQLPSSNTLNHGMQNVTTAGTAVQLPDQPCREATVIARRNNSGYIYLGGATVSSSNYGIELAAKDSITLKVDNTNLIYIDADNSGEGVTYIAI